MSIPTFPRVLLLVSGLIAVGIGASLLFAPVAFHAGYGTDLGSDANLLSEIRAPGGALLVLGVLMLVGAFDASFHRTALVLGAAVYLSYGLTRLVSVALDGMPGEGLLLAIGIELALGGACLAARLRAAPGGAPARPMPAHEA